tara:strand:+ start:18905 stop:21022 length:2118 start_codon:yes stop_codon:yes gene_type:complete
MVYSNINTTVFYNEDGNIDKEDVGYESTIYEMEIFGKRLLIVFGKLKYTFIQRNIVYVPIYLVIYNKVKKQIGVVEMVKNDTLDILDEDKDINIDKITTPLTFGFLNETFVDRYSSSNNLKELIDLYNSKETEETEEPEETEEEEKVESDEDEDAFSVKVKPSQKTKNMSKIDDKLLDGIFTKDKNVKPLKDLPEETEEIAKKIRLDFEGTPNDNWLQTYIKSSSYNIHDVERNGDCFFAVIRDAFKQIGNITTVEKLRALLAKHVTEKVFSEHRELFVDISGTINEYNRKLTEIKEKTEKDLNVRAKKSKNNKYELRAILNEIKDLKENHKQLLKSKQLAQSMIEEDVGDFKLIDTLEKFREYIQTSGFWANSWAISVLEKLLNVKFIILSERAYIENDIHNVLLCGEIHEDIKSKGVFNPDYYIITTFSGNHYQLVEYKDKRLFKFFEIPYYIKTLILNKCLEHNSGPYYLIDDFKDLKSKIGIDNDESDDEIEMSNMYDNNTVFEFYRNSNNTSKPGKGTNEKIPNNKRSEYIELSKIPNWRRKLDDSWSESPFVVDGKKWISVEHYYQGSKFKKNNTDFYHLFSLDSTSSHIAKDVDLAMSAGSKNGRANAKAKKKLKTEDTLLRPKNIEVDPDFYGERSEKEREIAITAKFEQNEDLKTMLLNTKNAKLIHFIHGAPGEKDDILMKVRYNIGAIESYASR